RPCRSASGDGQLGIGLPPLSIGLAATGSRSSARAGPLLPGPCWPTSLTRNGLAVQPKARDEAGQQKDSRECRPVLPKRWCPPVRRRFPGARGSRLSGGRRGGKEGRHLATRQTGWGEAGWRGLHAWNLGPGVLQHVRRDEKGAAALPWVLPAGL